MSLKDFTDMVLPIKDKLFRFSFRIVGNVAEAEDVVQEVFIKVWNKRQELHQLQNLEAWCMRATKNLSIDKLRSKHRRLSSIPDGFDIRSNAATPDRLVEGYDTLNRVRKLIAELPEKQRMIIQLRDIEGLSYQEITEILDISINQVKVNLFRARKQIKTQIINTESYGL